MSDIRYTPEQARNLGYVCPHCNTTFEMNEGVTDAAADPDDDDIGVCNNCRRWWIMKNGAFMKATPEIEREGWAELAKRGRTL